MAQEDSGEPRYEIGIDYKCGCMERWPVYRLRDDESDIILADHPCAPAYCLVCKPIYQSANRSWCDQSGFEKESMQVCLAELAEHAQKKPKTRHYTRDKRLDKIRS